MTRVQGADGRPHGLRRPQLLRLDQDRQQVRRSAGDAVHVRGPLQPRWRRRPTGSSSRSPTSRRRSTACGRSSCGTATSTTASSWRASSRLLGAGRRRQRVADGRVPRGVRREGNFEAAPDTWFSGIDRARAGIMMRGDPQVGTPRLPAGDYARRSVRRVAFVKATGRRDCVPTGCYDDVLVTDETNPTEPNDGHQLKYYAPKVGNTRAAAGRQGAGDPRADQGEEARRAGDGRGAEPRGADARQARLPVPAGRVGVCACRNAVRQLTARRNLLLLGVDPARPSAGPGRQPRGDRRPDHPCQP